MQRVIAGLSAGGEKLEHATLAYLGRVKKPSVPLTLSLDQLDRKLTRNDSDFINRLCSGAERGAKIALTEETKRKGGGKTFTPERLDLFYPIALAKIGGLTDAALKSRVITIEMAPATPDEFEALRRRRRGGADPAVRDMLKAALAACGEKLGATLPDMPPGIANRAYDKWHPLLAIADEAGGEWPERARKAVVELENTEDEDTRHIELLRDAVTIANRWPHPVIFSDELADELGKRGAEPLSDRTRGSLLRKVGVKSANRRRGERQRKGYKVADIKAQAARWLPKAA